MTWFQLTYASAEAAPGRSGGWDVQEVTPGTPAAIEARMRAGVITRLETMDGLGDFPATAELATRTRRLAFRFDDDDGASVWWHAVEAGDDATGRPGNVFTHSVAIAGRQDTLRPIDLWRSPSWLMPFGQKEVAEASLRGFELTETLHRQAAIERAFARQEQTEALLCAVADCLEEGRSLVLASESQDEFAAWLSVVSHLTAGRVAAGTLAFSTFERAARMTQALENACIVGIPASDLAQARASIVDPAVQRILVLDLDNLPSAPPDGDWEYAGQRWPSKGLWQEAFFELTDAGRYGRDQVESILALMDARSADGDDYRNPGSPLASALMASCSNDTGRLALLEQWSGRLGVDVQAIEAMLSLAPSEAVTESDAVPESPPVSDHEVNRHAPEVRLAEQPVLAITLNLPAPADASEAHRRLAESLLQSPDVLPSGQDLKLRVEQWIHDYGKHRHQRRQADEMSLDSGVSDG